MEKEYYQIKYKSNSQDVGHIIEKEGDSIKILNNRLSVEELGIEFSNGNWFCFPIYNEPKKVLPSFAKAIEFARNRNNIDKKLENF